MTSSTQATTSFEILGARQSLTTKSQAARDAARALARGHGTMGRPVYVLESGSSATIRAESASPFEAITPVLRVSSAGRRGLQGSNTVQEPATASNISPAYTATSKSTRPTSAPAVQAYLTAAGQANSTSTRASPSIGLHVTNGVGAATVPGTQGSTSNIRLGPITSSKERPMSPLHRVASMREVTSSVRGWPGSQMGCGPVRPASASCTSAYSHLTIRRSWSLGSQPRSASTSNTGAVAGAASSGSGRGASDDGQSIGFTPRTEEILASMFKHLDLDASRAGVPAVTSGTVGSVATVNAPGKIVTGRSTIMATGAVGTSRAKLSYGPLFPAADAGATNGEGRLATASEIPAATGSSTASWNSSTSRGQPAASCSISQTTELAMPPASTAGLAGNRPVTATTITPAGKVAEANTTLTVKTGITGNTTPCSLSLGLANAKAAANSLEASTASPSNLNPLASPDVPPSTSGEPWAIRTVLGTKKATSQAAATITASTSALEHPSSPTHSSPITTAEGTSKPGTTTSSANITTTTSTSTGTTGTSSAATSSTGAASRKSNLTLDMSKIRSPFADHAPAKVLSKVTKTHPHLHTAASAIAATAIMPASSPIKAAASPGARVATSPSGKVVSSPKAAALESTAAPAAFVTILNQRTDLDSSTVASPGMRLITGHGVGKIIVSGTSVAGRSPASQRRYNPSEPQPPAISDQEMQALLAQIPGAASLPHRSCEVVGELLSESSQLSDVLGLDWVWMSTVIHHHSPVRVSLESV